MWCINQRGLIKRQTWKSGDVAHSPGRRTLPLYTETYSYTHTHMHIWGVLYILMTVFFLSFSPMCWQWRGDFQVSHFFCSLIHITSLIYVSISSSQIRPTVCWKALQSLPALNRINSYFPQKKAQISDLHHPPFFVSYCIHPITFVSWDLIWLDNEKRR